jgi:hypothetical protein
MILGMSVFVSCSKNDDNQSPTEKDQLELTVSKNEVVVNEEVTFTVTANGKTIADAVLFINDEAVSGMKHTFTEAGTYTVIAKKEGYKESNPQTIIVKQADVYVAGYSHGEGTYWKNGEATTLTDIEAHGIWVAGQDLYIAGVKYAGGGKTIPVYLKNGVETPLTDGTTRVFVTSMFVDGADVYVAGIEINMETDGTSAVYWKNKEKHILSPELYRTRANAIFVSDGQVYVAGDEEEETTGMGMPVYWKNTIKQTLPKDKATNHANAYGIFVKENHIYIAGSEYQTARLWQLTINGELKTTAMDHLPQGLEANAVFVSGNDVYVAGKGTDQKAHYWKNGIIQNLEGNEGAANSIFVWNNEVHIAGHEAKNNKYSPKYWKNGVGYNLSENDTNGDTFSVFVAEK